ncbi:MAG TPA: amidohydrolase family protein [Cyclobacteriaceae bacterium]|nr:amidohydrolase family protein [Cyclobacteriaceae bacterium]
MKLLSFILCLVATQLFAQPVDNTNKEIIITNVSVIPMDTERVLENQSVIVKNGVITYVGDAKNAKPSKDATKVDGKGKFLIPGLAEMHAHVPPNGDIDQAKDVLALFLANGITTTRGMLGHPNHLKLRTMINNGEVVAPHFYTTGPSFNGQSVKTPERGAEMVREQKAAGYDYLKLHPGLTKETFPAIASTAKEVGIPFAGHVSFGVGVWRAIDAGYSSIDHMDGFIEAITPGIDTLAEQETGLFGSWIAINADESKIPNLVSKLAEKKIWVVPTQALAERWQSPQPASVYLNTPEMKYMKPEDLKNWENAKNGYLNNPNYSKEKAEALIRVRRNMLRQCQKGGVGLLLGSDAPQIFNVPGFSAHHELKYLVDAGLTPYEALRTGTVNVATYLGKTNSGSIKAGNESDLVLLGGNPLKDINQTKAVEGVMIGKKWLSKEYIASELKRLERK